MALSALPFGAPVLDLVQHRTSCRSFAAEPLAPATVARLQELCAAAPVGPFPAQVRPTFVLGRDDSRDGKRFGTYGVIRGATDFWALPVTTGPGAMETLGYVGEWLILHAAALDLGTCWLGGTFARDAFSVAVGLTSAEVLPAVVAIGVPAETRSVVDRAMRFFAGSKDRLPAAELFFAGDFTHPLDPISLAADPLEPALQAVRAAPSASNRQPWRIVRERTPDGHLRYHFFLRRTPGYGRFSPYDLQRIDMGIAMGHFAWAARELGQPGVYAPTPDAAGGLAPLPANTEYVTTLLTHPPMSETEGEGRP